MIISLTSRIAEQNILIYKYSKIKNIILWYKDIPVANSSNIYKLSLIFMLKKIDIALWLL